MREYIMNFDTETGAMRVKSHTTSSTELSDFEIYSNYKQVASSFAKRTLLDEVFTDVDDVVRNEIKKHNLSADPSVIRVINYFYGYTMGERDAIGYNLETDEEYVYSEPVGEEVSQLQVVALLRTDCNRYYVFNANNVNNCIHRSYDDNSVIKEVTNDTFNSLKNIIIESSDDECVSAFKCKQIGDEYSRFKYSAREAAYEVKVTTK